MPEPATRWERVSELFAAALEQPAGERRAYLERAAGGDESLLLEVESLLGAEPQAEQFFHSLADETIPSALSAMDDWNEPSRVGRSYGPYDVVEEIGRGGMGVVYRAEDRRLGRSVALKFLPSATLSDPGARRRLHNEARAASVLDDPNICTIFELDETPEGEAFIVMAYYDGETLAQRLERGPVPIGEALVMAVGIARGLAVAHAHGIVHRDLTPRNIMLPSRHSVKILDFGLAGVAGEGASRAAGTPAYMPPEQVLGDMPGPAGDLWSFGVTLYELFSHARPFGGRDTGTILDAVLGAEPVAPRKLNPDIPESLERLILRMLEKQPAARPADAGTVLKTLESIVERYRLRRSRQVAVGIVSVLALAVLGLLATGRPDKAPASVPEARVVFGPLESDSSRPDAIYLAAGLHRAIANELSRMPGIALISWTSGLAGEATPRARRRTARALGAVAVLEGQIIGDDSATLRLHDAEDDHVIWTTGENFRRRSSAGVGRELAVQIVTALRPTSPQDSLIRHPGMFATDPTTGHVYEAVPVTTNWYDAERAALARTHDGMRGHLAVITSAGEDDFVARHLRQAVTGGYWLGGYRATRGRTARDGWYWVTGESFDYANWSDGGPNDWFGEDGLQYWPSADSSRWNDIDRIDGFEPFVKGFLVEYSP